MHYVYMIECSDGSLYTGYTTDVARRFKQHQKGRGGHYTSSRTVMRIVHTEEYPDKSSALKREAEIKRWTREEKLRLIQDRPH